MNTIPLLLSDWATEHWWLAFWLVFWLGAWAYLICLGLLRTANRALRTIKVALRGWPPAHLDADGDWPPASVVKTERVGDVSCTTERRYGGTQPVESAAARHPGSLGTRG